MDKFIDSRFERLERALSALIDSVTKYNPSPAHAIEVDAADRELTGGLREVERHQCNHIRIQELREASNALDSQIRDTLASLAAARKDVKLSHPVGASADPLFPVNCDDLLSYARRISKTTLPPLGVINASDAPSGAAIIPPTEPSASQVASVPVPAQAQAQAAQVRSQSQPPPTPNPIQSQPPPTPNLIQSPVSPTSAAGQMPNNPPTQPTGAPAASQHTGLPAVITDYLNPLTGVVFFPWPAEDRLRMGSLAANQSLTERGIDPRGFDPVEEEARKRREEEARREQEEREPLERQAQEKRMREERERLRREREASTRKEDTGHPAAARPPPSDRRQFQFANLDDLEEDDDDED